MESVMLDTAGHRRSPATMPGYHRGRPPRNMLLAQLTAAVAANSPSSGQTNCASANESPAGTAGLHPACASAMASFPRSSARISPASPRATTTSSHQPGRTGRPALPAKASCRCSIIASLGLINPEAVRARCEGVVSWAGFVGLGRPGRAARRCGRRVCGRRWSQRGGCSRRWSSSQAMDATTSRARCRPGERERVDPTLRGGLRRSRAHRARCSRSHPRQRPRHGRRE